MKFIAHRGNVSRRIGPLENSPSYITTAINLGHDVEVDVWLIDDVFYLGHDEPQYKVERDFVLNDKFWIHAKNIDALNALKDSTNCFFHNTDDAVLTSKGFIWTYPSKKLVEGAICVMPQTGMYTHSELDKCYAICSDDKSICNRLN